jgi:hypothetical protein
VYADELTVNGEYDVKTWMQQDLKREQPGVPPPVGKSTHATYNLTPHHPKYMYIP